MKKTLILGFILMLAAASAFATETRVLTMGENNNIMIDDANVWMYPSRVNNYPNIGVGEFSRYGYGEGFYSFGLNWKFNEKNPWVLGTYFSATDPVQPAPYYGYYPGFSTYGNYDYYDYSLDLSSNRRIDLLYGRKFGTTNFGFGLGYVSSSWKAEETSDKSEESFKHYAFTFGLTPDNGQWDVAALFALGSWTDKNDEGKEETKPDGYTDLQLYGRYFHKVNQTITLVPHAGIWFGKHGQESFDPDSSLYSSKLTSFELGCGLHYQPVTNVLAVLDFGFQSSKVTEEFTDTDDNGDNDSVFTYKNSVTRLPYWKLGLEGDVFPWLDVRFGAVSNWTSWKVEEDRNTFNDEKGSYASNQTYLGFGFNWNRLHVDTYANPDLFLRGFDFITGASGEGDNYMNWQLSVLYEMF